MISVPTKTEPLCLPPIQPLPSGVTAPAWKPCPSGSVCLPPLGPWPLQVPYQPKPALRYPYGFKPVRLANGPFPAVGGHSWNVPLQKFKICGTGSLPKPTGAPGTAVPVGTGVGVGPKPMRTGVGVRPMPTGTATANTVMSSGVRSVAMPTGTTRAIVPAPIGGPRG